MSPKLKLLISFSILLNALLGYNYVQNSKELNLSLNNSIHNFVSILVSISERPETTARIDFKESEIDYRISEISKVNQQIHGLTALPYASKIVPNEFIQQLYLLTNYNYQVLELMKKDIEEEGKVSEENRKRFETISHLWWKTLVTLQEGANQINPFSPIFQATTWQKVWTDSMSVFDEVELIPLPE